MDDHAAVAAALDMALTDPIALVSSERSAVLRCRTSAGSTVVVKCYPDNAAGAESFAAEAAGLGFTATAGFAPRLLAIDPGTRAIVMEDLGTVPSLADLLLAGSAADAEACLLGWARACGELAVSSVGRQQELTAAVSAYRDAARTQRRPAHAPGSAHASSSGGMASASARAAASTDVGDGGGAGNWLERRILEIPGLLGALAIQAPAGLADDLADVASSLRTGRWQVFSPGDICPDNNLITADGPRLIDFESADFHSVFLDAAYLRMPFSSCWCVFGLPARLAAAAEAVYRNLLCQVFPELADDGIWQPGLRRAMAAWTLHAMIHLLDRSVVADASMNGVAPAAPTARQLLRHRWQRLRSELEPAAELPAILALVHHLITATEHWHTPELPFYPSFQQPAANLDQVPLDATAR
ncbi:MAG TPA: hypothetical protein VNF47_14545 [Streptosporangiaceae bacterium]|nr:hypothetical protein [Streptosporangiaceae bacterium]